MLLLGYSSFGFMRQVYAHHVPPIRRLPQVMWAQLRHDLFDYLVEKESGGVRVLIWYHRQFLETAQDRYVGSSKRSVY